MLVEPHTTFQNPVLPWPPSKAASDKKVLPVAEWLEVAQSSYVLPLKFQWACRWHRQAEARQLGVSRILVEDIDTK